MCLTKKDIFTGQSSGNNGSSNLQVLRGHWASNGHHTALRTANQDLEPSFLRSFHLESCMLYASTFHGERLWEQNQVPSLS